ncbi:MAG: DNA-binding protein [Bacteroidota bacterium]
MKSLIFFVLSLIVLSFLYADLHQAAQQVRRGKSANSWGMKGLFQRLYDINTMEKVSGEVLRVETFVPLEDMGPGVCLFVKAATDTAEVHLGPRWFIENQEIKFQATDQIAVCASKVTLNGRIVFVAATVEREDGILQLRDKNGIPVWVAWESR